MYFPTDVSCHSTKVLSLYFPRSWAHMKECRFSSRTSPSSEVRAVHKGHVTHEPSMNSHGCGPQGLHRGRACAPSAGLRSPCGMQGCGDVLMPPALPLGPGEWLGPGEEGEREKRFWVLPARTPSGPWLLSHPHSHPRLSPHLHSLSGSPISPSLPGSSHPRSQKYSLGFLKG